MKVIQVIPDYSTESSGPAYYIANMVRALRGNGVDAHIYSAENEKQSHPEPYAHTFRRHTFPIPSMGRSPELLASLEKDIPSSDIVHSNSLWMLPNIYPGRIVGKLRGKGVYLPKLVTSPHGTLANWALRRSGWKKRLIGVFGQYAAMKATDMWHATCEKEYQEIRAQGYKQPVAIVPIGMDVPTFQVSCSKFRVSGSAAELKRVVFFGRLHKVKGIDRLLLAWEKLARDGWELVIAGPDCGMLDALKGIVADRKLPHVSFVGEINGQAKYEFLADADIYVLPSDTENFGITVAEALACGTPVIASQGTPWEGLEREKCGRWVPIGVEPLEVALKDLMAMDDKDRKLMGERGREWIVRDFSWEGIGLKMKSAYEWLLEPEATKRPEWIRED